MEYLSLAGLDGVLWQEAACGIFYLSNRGIGMLHSPAGHAGSPPLQALLKQPVSLLLVCHTDEPK